MHETIVYEAQPPSRPLVTRGLPPDVMGFTGRQRELERLLAVAGPGRVVNIHTVDGMPGVGKTALATRAAHLLAEHFPDGQFFYDLHAHTPEVLTAQPVDVLAVLLTDLGIDPTHLPSSLEGRSHLWRDRLAGKRVLLVLDDAVGHAQIQPLLAASPGCLTLITSRRRLIALDGADPVSLAPLTPSEAAQLFVRRARRTPTDSSEREAVAGTVRLCGYLPLAITLLAGRLRHKDPVLWPLARFAAEFADAQEDRLGEFDDGDNRAVYTAFTLSYRDLPADQQRLFRRIGLHPGPDTDAYAAAALDGTSPAATRRRLEALYTDHLLDETAPGRYQPHDLLREYACTLTLEHDTRDDRAQAAGRLLDYYLHAAQIADQHLAPVTPYANSSTGSQVTTPGLPDRAAALAWMRIERDNLLACIGTSTIDQAPHAVRLTASIAAFLLQDGPWPQAATLHQRAAQTAHHNNDPVGEANALRDLGRVRYMTDDYEQATGLQERALALFKELGDWRGQANALNDLGCVYRMIGDYEQATGLQERALGLFEELGIRSGQANVLHELGRVRCMTDDYEQATGLQERALALFEELGIRSGQADVLHELGRLRYMTGDYEQATGLQERALALFEELGTRLGQANALHDLGCVRYLTDDYEQATGFLERALALYEELGTRLGQANALHELGRVRYMTGDNEQATGLLERVLALYVGLGDRLGQANALSDLGRVCRLIGDYEQATGLLERALALSVGLGDRLGQANALSDLGRVRCLIGDYEQATGLLERALALYVGLGTRLGQANALNDLGCVCRLTDDYEQATRLHEQALTLFREIGDRQGEAEVWNNVGALLAKSNGAQEALRPYRKALELARQIRSRRDEALALEGMAHCHERLGGRKVALEELHEALAIYRSIEAAEADRATQFLSRLKAEDGGGDTGVEDSTD
ncbi:tetratricopeptide repeat protein [Streptomyces formicae]|uniref:tetratricopeptide repeat protein n=1 Tax=Streptomyces formicae TaxID=1616117 RepID=UPI00131CBC5C|nr:tetratricopeptide repeat protein [Streptomyces formicae]